MVVLRGREGVLIALLVVIAILGALWLTRSGGPDPVTVASGCAAYASQAEAQRAMDAGVKGLDGDGDGIACESLR